MTLHIDDGNEWYENLGSDVQTYDSEAGVQTTGEEIPDASDYSNGGMDDTILIQLGFPKCAEHSNGKPTLWMHWYMDFSIFQWDL